MTRRISTTDLIAELTASKEPWVRRVTSILKCFDPTEVVQLDVIEAVELHRTYSARLLAQQEGAGPAADNLDRFVCALEPPGPVELFSVKTSVEQWIVMLRNGTACSYVRIPLDHRHSTLT